MVAIVGRIEGKDTWLVHGAGRFVGGTGRQNCVSRGIGKYISAPGQFVTGGRVTDLA